MRGKLYALGIGPGDPELMTLKAQRILREAPVICVPLGREDGQSVALRIVEGAVDLGGKEMLEVHFPMKKGSQRDALRPAAEEVLRVLDSGRDVAFPTLGDPVLYSTFFHLYDALLSLSPEVEIEVVPGVSSINASAARAGMSLTLSGDRLAVLPATYIEDMGMELRKYDTVVLMKVNSVLDRIKDKLEHEGLLESAVYVSRVGMDGETVKPLRDVLPGDVHYFSTVIVRKKNNG